MKYLGYREEKGRVIVKIRHWLKDKEFSTKFGLVYDKYPEVHSWYSFPAFKVVSLYSEYKLQKFLDSCIRRIMFEKGIEIIK